MRKEGLSDEALRDAVSRAARGLIDADLGSGVIKQRVARRGQGRSGGYRTLIAFKAAERSVFLFGFAKSDQDNIDAGVLRILPPSGRGDVELERKADCRDAGNRCVDGGRLAMRKYKSKIAAAVHEAMQDAHDAGVIDKRTMRQF